MTLMDAPKFDAAVTRRRSQLTIGFLGGFFLLMIAAWLVVGHPMDMPWNWWTYWEGKRTAESFLQAVESKDLNGAYAIWVHDPEWQQHADKYKTYPFKRFEEDWGPNSSANDYGTFTTHQVVVSKVWGSSLIVGSLINGRKSSPLFLAYDRKAHTLGFSPVELTIDR